MAKTATVKPPNDDPFVTTQEPERATNLPAVAAKAATSLPAVAVDMTDRFAGLDTNDFEIPALHLFQDVGKESERYGSHPKGVWIDAMTTTEVKSPVIVPITVTKSIEVWYQMNSTAGKGFVARFNIEAEVPEMYRAEAQTYSVLKVITWFVIVDGLDMPYAIRFKSTAVRSGMSLNTMEKLRATSGKGLGKYRLESKQSSNDKGKWYIPIIVPDGDATDSQSAAAVQAYQLLRGKNVVVNDGTDPLDEDTGFADGLN